MVEADGGEVLLLQACSLGRLKACTLQLGVAAEPAAVGGVVVRRGRGGCRREVAADGSEVLRGSSLQLEVAAEPAAGGPKVAHAPASAH